MRFLAVAGRGCRVLSLSGVLTCFSPAAAAFESGAAMRRSLTPSMACRTTWEGSAAVAWASSESQHWAVPTYSGMLLDSLSSSPRSCGAREEVSRGLAPSARREERTDLAGSAGFDLGRQILEGRRVVRRA